MPATSPPPQPCSPRLRVGSVVWPPTRATTPTGSGPTYGKKGITPIIPGKRGRKRKIRHDKRRYRERWRIEATFNRLKDFRRIATRYDKLARNYVSAVALAAVIAFWC